MASKKKLLTFHSNHNRNGGRWRKQIDGKVRYFGHGDSADDIRSYRAAEQAYVEFLKKKEEQQPAEVPVSKATVEEVVERYLQGEFARAQRGEISAGSYEKTRRAAEVFTDSVGPRRRFAEITELDLDGYRDEQLALPVSPHSKKPIKPSTAKLRLDFVKSLITWAWERRLIEMPRNMRRYATVNMPKPEANPFTVEEIQQLWSSAGRLRCFMALGLNCAFGQQDISDLAWTDVDLDVGYIERPRSKTGIWARYKLWPVTIELIQAEAAKGETPGNRVFTNTSGLPLVRRWLTDNGKLKMSDCIKNLMWRNQQAQNINGGRGFYALRTTGATEIERINPLVTAMYLSHAERGQKRHYAVPNWSALDDALDELGRVFALDSF